MKFNRLAGLILVAGAVGCGSSSALPDGSGTAGTTGSAGTTGVAGTTGSAGTTGAAGTTGSAGTTGAAGTTGGGGTGPAPADHRPQAVACPATTGFPPRDGGAVSCTKDSDCVSDGAYNADRFCRQHSCSVDQCLTDGDCATTEACGCASQFGGNILHTNLCIPTACHVDADCGAGGFCSPATNNRCGSLSGYHCHGPADTCHTAADCAAQHDGGITLPTSCAYAPEVDHWQCVAVTVCNG